MRLRCLVRGARAVHVVRRDGMFKNELHVQNHLLSLSRPCPPEPRPHHHVHADRASAWVWVICGHAG